MIEIINDKERNLKNIKQIGTPKEENKIYVEHIVYAKIKETSYKEKRVFVLMGHTERLEGRYVTFVEGIIPVREIDFSGNTPRWNNAIWSEVFREIKRLYEDMIIVGWAVDVKGMLPKVTPELERVHREHFGGVHQLLLLLDTLEQEETFYMYKENKVVSKDGFYIYHKARKKECAEVLKEEQELISIKVLDQKQEMFQQGTEQVDVEVDIRQEEHKKIQHGQYRQFVNMHDKKTRESASEGNLGIAIAVAMLVFVIGVGLYEDKDKLFAPSESVTTNAIQEQNSNVSQIISEQEKGGGLNEEGTETVQVDLIPVDVISGTEQTDEEK